MRKDSVTCREIITMISETRFGETKQFIAAQVRGIRKCIMCSAYIVPKYERLYLSPINLPN